ncbi:hypothetical protein NM2007461_2160 [Neisseria meningitidis 2007461]|nr:hypothetical protein NM2007461_2160 [Neisseria meningitidis 2007461]
MHLTTVHGLPKVTGSATTYPQTWNELCHHIGKLSRACCLLLNLLFINNFGGMGHLRDTIGKCHTALINGNNHRL